MKTIFEGEWTDIGYATLLGGLRYQFTFKSDSFYLQKHQWTDVDDPTPCRHSMAWIEYYSGTFRFDKDSIYLTGERTDSLNKMLEQNDCIKEINFIVSYKYRFETDTLIFLPREYMRARDPEFVNKYERHFAIYLKEGLENYEPQIGPPPQDEK